jgi:segregation and condensation protein B
MPNQELLSAIESILFVSGEPLSLVRLAKILNSTEEEMSELVGILARSYSENTASGLMLLQENKTVLLATKQKNATYIEDVTKSTLQEGMSKAALEVLSIIAYRAPIARVEIDAIRGVNCSFTLRNLLLRDLISREGNPSDSRGYLYRPTLRFLQVLGMESVADLPDFKTLSQDERLSLILEQGEAPMEEGGGILHTTDQNNK